MIAFPGVEPEQYESGTVPEVDALLAGPSKLYELPEERMDSVREQYVRMILGIEQA